MEFGRSEGTFKLRKFLVYLVKLPSELQISQNLTRESRFVVYSRTRKRKVVNDGIWPFWGHFYTKKFLVYLVKMPSELQNCQNLTHQSLFVVYVAHANKKW